MSEPEDEREAPASQVRRARLGVVAAAVAVVLGAGALSVAVTRDTASASATGASCGGSTPRLTVQGTGRSSGSPDVLDFQAQVDVSAPTATGALGRDNAVASAVIAAIEFAGVEPKDISTTNLSISPNYDYTDGSSVITGYGASNDIAVRVRKLGSAGSVIDAASNAGGDALSVSSLNFSRSDPRTLEDRARQDAVHQAVTHAAAMARASGERLNGLCSLTDQSSLDQGPPVTPFASGLAAASPLVPLEGGTSQATAQVTLVYALAPLGR